MPGNSLLLRLYRGFWIALAAPLSLLSASVLLAALLQGAPAVAGPAPEPATKNTPIDNYYNSDSVMGAQTPMQRDVAPYNEHERNRNPHTKSNDPQSGFIDYNTTPKVQPPAASRGYYNNSNRALDSGSRPWRSY